MEYETFIADRLDASALQVDFCDDDYDAQAREFHEQLANDPSIEIKLEELAMIQSMAAPTVELTAEPINEIVDISVKCYPEIVVVKAQDAIVCGLNGSTTGQRRDPESPGDGARLKAAEAWAKAFAAPVQ